MKSSELKVSLIIPVYNASRYLERAIKSAIKQSYANLEIILVDDGSFDDSSIICKKYARKYKNIFYFYKNNAGVSSARNLGLKKATGDYIVFLDSDDLISKNAIKDLVTNYKKDELVSVKVERVGSDGKKRMLARKNIYDTENVIQDIMTDNLQGFVWGFIFEREKCVDFDERVNYCEDVIFMITYILKNNIKSVKFLNENRSYYCYCWNENIITNSKSNLFKRMEEIDMAMNIVKDIVRDEEKNRLVNNREVELFESMMGYLTDEDIKRIIKAVKLPNYSGKSFRMKYFANLYHREKINRIFFYYAVKDKVKRVLDTITKR